MFSKALTTFTLALILGKARGAVQYAGVNIAGFDFGCTTSGACDIASVYGPVGANRPDGAGQMQHFVGAFGFNMFRLSVGWQYLFNSKLGGELDPKAIGSYDKLVQSCIDTGAFCVIDVHNYARWDGQVIGQGGSTDEQLASAWSQLAEKYASESRVVFGVMNEPHDLLDIATWAKSVQAAVTAIRKAGATSQMILLPGHGPTSAGTFVSSGSADALNNVTNLDGTYDNLILDMHKYLDSDNSGTDAECVTDAVKDAFSPLASYLRAASRQAILSEIGGGSNTSSCSEDVCSTLDFLNENSDVYIGYTAWAASSFDTDYILSLTPKDDASSGWTDQELMAKCFADKFNGSGNGNNGTSSNNTDGATSVPFTNTIYAIATALSSGTINTAVSTTASVSYARLHARQFPGILSSFPSDLVPSIPLLTGSFSLPFPQPSESMPAGSSALFTPMPVPTIPNSPPVIGSLYPCQLEGGMSLPTRSSGGFPLPTCGLPGGPSPSLFLTSTFGLPIIPRQYSGPATTFPTPPPPPPGGFPTGNFPTPIGGTMPAPPFNPVPPTGSLPAGGSELPTGVPPTTGGGFGAKGKRLEPNAGEPANMPPFPHLGPSECRATIPPFSVPFPTMAGIPLLTGTGVPFPTTT